MEYLQSYSLSIDWVGSRSVRSRLARAAESDPILASLSSEPGRTRPAIWAVEGTARTVRFWCNVYEEADRPALRGVGDRLASSIDASIATVRFSEFPRGEWVNTPLSVVFPDESGVAWGGLYLDTWFSRRVADALIDGSVEAPEAFTLERADHGIWVVFVGPGSNETYADIDRLWSALMPVLTRCRPEPVPTGSRKTRIKVSPATRVSIRDWGDSVVLRVRVRAGSTTPMSSFASVVDTWLESIGDQWDREWRSKSTTRRGGLQYSHAMVNGFELRWVVHFGTYSFLSDHGELDRLLQELQATGDGNEVVAVDVVAWDV